MSETELMHQIMIAASRSRLTRVFRNQVGRYKLSDGRWISSGLTTGSSDLVGWHSVVVTPGMVGSRIALFLAIEVKAGTAQASHVQTRFLNSVHEAGGIAILARDVESVTTILDQPGEHA